MDVDKLQYACYLWSEIRVGGTDVQLEIEVGILRFWSASDVRWNMLELLNCS